MENILNDFTGHAHHFIGHAHRDSPFVVAIVNQKGGVGKTTLAINIATKLHLSNYRVLLVDSDAQGSARDWRNAGEGKGNELTVIALDRKNLAEDIKKVSSNFDWVIIDGVPKIEQMAVAAVKCSDLVIIPVQPSSLDIWATEDIVHIIQARHNVTVDKPKAYFCITQKRPNTLLGKDIEGACKELGFPALESSTSHRESYKKNISDGGTVFDTRDLKAINEITNIVNEIKKILI